MNKKAIELSLNFIIVIFLSIIIMIGGIAFTYRFLGVVKERQATIDEQTKRQIESLLLDGHQTAIPIDRIKIKRGDHATFGLGIYNTMTDIDTFRVAITYSNAYTPTEDETLLNVGVTPASNYIDTNWVFGLRDLEYTVMSNQYELVPIPVNVGGNIANSEITKAGIYEFNICVCPCDPPGPPNTGFDVCKPTDTTFCHARCVRNDKHLYGGRIMKFYVEVPQ